MALMKAATITCAVLLLLSLSLNAYLYQLVDVEGFVAHAYHQEFDDAITRDVQIFCQLIDWNLSEEEIRDAFNVDRGSVNELRDGVSNQLSVNGGYFILDESNRARLFSFWLFEPFTIGGTDQKCVLRW